MTAQFVHLTICCKYVVTEILESDSTVEASRVLQLLNEEDIPDLPPGSVLGAK